MIKLVSEFPDFFALNGNMAVRWGEGFGTDCAKCGRKISAPFGYENKLIWCLYCGMEHGFVPMVEQPIGSHRFPFGVTREECVEDRKALDAGTFDKVWERRARRYGHIWDMFP